MTDSHARDAAAPRVHRVLLFLKRRPGMSVADFRDYYENIHSKFGEKYSRGLLGYVRNYLDPVGDEELPFDVITELWVADRATAEAIAAGVARNQPLPEILEDEKQLFDRSKTRVATVVECRSTLPAPNSENPGLP
ncbi:EthD domain-containing protein [Nocardia aurea]|uniref:EthD domain-containing protein n=1 Tax=Nocardia aurea TaxID=2144174 RepID=A0ABV3G0P0_9NOCA